MANDERRPARARLDQPIEPRRVALRANYDPEAFGRFSERIARFLGTGRFLVYQSAFIVLWVVVNTLPGIPHFDPYTFTFLTLILSLQAAYAAPLILLAQNRQDDRDRVNMEQDRQQSGQQLADLDFVARELAAVRLALRDVATRDFLRSELRTLLEDDHGDGEHPRKDKKTKKKRAPAVVQEPAEPAAVRPAGTQPAPEHADP
ncbi:MAG TPA: DUF1003 domain-containing protein [Mycobacteriales bacterium]|jgi:uncharacterized membrane protein|nr:DUF1003 domain-containing protein [Mycobacteriales bacterium]